jgi:anti-anti-sigma factor
METGNFLAAQHQGVFIIKLKGDVRLTLCCVIDDFLQEMFEAENLVSVSVDLTETIGVDSTSLGMLAKLALRVHEVCGVQPVLVSTNENITYLIKSMGFDSIFAITDDPVACQGKDLQELTGHDCDENEVREKVIEAHRVLMGMSEDNRERFSDLVTALEASR